MKIDCENSCGRSCVGIVGKTVLTFMPNMKTIPFFKNKIYAVICDKREKEITHSYIFLKCLGITVVFVDSVSAFAYGDKVSIDTQRDTVEILPQASTIKKPKVLLTSLDGSTFDLEADIGLWRTEGLLLGADKTDFTDVYNRVLSDKIKTVVRLFDFEGDKESLAGDRREKLESEQLAQLISTGKQLKLLIPNVRTAADIIEVRKFAENKKHPSQKIFVGSMVETPDAVKCINDILNESDYICIGLNGLRRNYNNKEKVLEIVLEMLTLANSQGVPCNVCGELLKDKELFLTLAACGTDGFCVSFDELRTCERLLGITHTESSDIPAFGGRLAYIET